MTKFKSVLRAGAVAAVMTLATGAQAITVQTSNFLTGNTNYNGFEGLGSTSNYSGAPYTEQGITVQYVGSASIWTDSQAAEGQFSWYENGGGTGYTKVTFGGGPINAIEFQAGSGWSGGGALSLQYEVLLAGNVIATGSTGPVSSYTGFGFFGFSGGAFDELHLQVQAPGYTGGFNGGNYEAGAYDAFNFGGSAVGGVPEPTSWAMLIGGFGLTGLAMRRRRTALAA